MTGSRRVALLLGLLVIVASAAGIYYLRPQTSLAAEAHATGPKDEAYDRFAAAARKAEDIQDPLERCLTYPDPPGTHWHADTTAAYCRMRLQKTITFAELRALIDQGKADEVDRTLQGYLDLQLKDPNHPGMLDAAYSRLKFQSADPGVRSTIDAWKRQSPKSAFALAASGLQYVFAAGEARGGGFASDMTYAQDSGMRDYLMLARTDLDLAATTQPTVTPTYGAMIIAGSMFGDRQYVDYAAHTGLGVDPLNFSIRAEWMDRSHPMWGGSYAIMQQQSIDAYALAPRNPLLRLVASSAPINVLTWAGNNRQVAQLLLPAVADAAMRGDLEEAANVAGRQHAPTLAIELYSEVIRFDPVDADVLRWRANLLRERGDVDWSVASVVSAAKRAPQDNAVALALGITYKSANLVREAEATYQAIIARDPDNQKAIAYLGDLYSHAGHQPDKAMALADQLISKHPDNPDGYVVRSCVQMDNNLPGRYETIHYFLEHFAGLPGQEAPAAEMRAYLARHPEVAGAG
jgi:tetratricopeptide (TPR) repeat protein